MKCKFIRIYTRKNEFVFEANLDRVPMNGEVVIINGQKFEVGEIRTVIDGENTFCEIAVGSTVEPMKRF